MKFSKKLRLGLATSAAAVLLASNGASAYDPKLNAEEAQKIGHEAYMYGYAIVENYKAIFGMCVYPKSNAYSGFNKYLHSRETYGPDYKTVVSANNDTLYSTTFADVRKEPLVVQVPPTGERYFTIQLVDMLTDNFAYIGTRSTGTEGGTFLVVGPDYKGSLETDLFDRIIVAQSPFVALATRTAVYGTDDLKNAHKVQDGLKLTGYSAFTGKTAFGRTETPEPMPMWIPDKVHEVEHFFPLLNQLLAWHSPSTDDMAKMKQFARIDVGPYSTFNADAMPAELMAAVKAGAEKARSEIIEKSNNLGQRINGWEYTPPMGMYGDDYLFRAAVAEKFIYTNSPEEAVYPIANFDASDKPLSGKNTYVLHFAKKDLPPVDQHGFWSMTLYDKDSRLMVANELNRYSIGDRSDGLRYNKDGSLTIYVQHKKPSADKISNWLPAPEGNFYLINRAYMPSKAFQTGEYRLPGLKKTNLF